MIVILMSLFQEFKNLLYLIQQVESQGQHILPNKDIGGILQTQAWNDIVSHEQSEKMQKVLDSSVDQIAGVKKQNKIFFLDSYQINNMEYHQYQQIYNKLIITGQEKLRRSRKLSKGRQQKRRGNLASFKSKQ